MRRVSVLCGPLSAQCKCMHVLLISCCVPTAHMPQHDKRFEWCTSVASMLDLTALATFHGTRYARSNDPAVVLCGVHVQPMSRMSAWIWDPTVTACLHVATHC
jgi:hypothetical protein